MHPSCHEDDLLSKLKSCVGSLNGTSSAPQANNNHKFGSRPPSIPSHISPQPQLQSMGHRVDQLGDRQESGRAEMSHRYSSDFKTSKQNQFRSEEGSFRSNYQEMLGQKGRMEEARPALQTRPSNTLHNYGILRNEPKTTVKDYRPSTGQDVFSQVPLKGRPSTGQNAFSQVPLKGRPSAGQSAFSQVPLKGRLSHSQIKKEISERYSPCQINDKDMRRANYTRPSPAYSSKFAERQPCPSPQPKAQIYAEARPLTARKAVKVDVPSRDPVRLSDRYPINQHQASFESSEMEATKSKYQRTTDGYARPSAQKPDERGYQRKESRLPKGDECSALQKLRKISQLNQKINDRIRNIITVFEQHKC